MQRRPEVRWDATTQTAFPETVVTHLHLLRHGAVDTGGERLAYGHSDLPLSAAGERTGGALLAFARDQLPAVDGVLTSDLSRCRILADQLGEALGLPVQALPELREQHMGDWEGRSWSSLTAEHEAVVRAYWTDYATTRPPGGESMVDLAARVDAWWTQAAPLLTGGRWVVVTHIGVIRVLLCRALGLPLDQALRMAPGRGTHTHLLHAATGWVVQALGEQVAHPDAVTAPAPVATASVAATPASLPPASPVRRIALAGSAGTGKSTLARRLADELDLPYIHEGMRARIEAGLDLHALDHAAFRALLWELWAEQQALEDQAVATAGGFVADRSPWDYAAFWLHYHFAEDRGETERLFTEVRARAARLDRILLLPWGGLPLLADGVRNPNPWLQRHYQACLEGLLTREAEPSMVLRMPGLDQLEGRVAWVLARIGGG